ncbi:MAG: efflux RND transporter periplasmic adaptor subunit [Bacteroidetes bacterium]|nr:efflux RND transporter periplasmic adaptor subunit [Bacteroidota bacterium]
MKRIYWIIIIIIVVGAAIGAWFIFGKKTTAAIQWRTGKVETGDLRIVVTATGTLNADTTVQVGTQVSGIIDKILVDFNSVVKKGQVVALLDTTYLAASVEDASSSMYRAQVQVNLTKRNYDRNKELFDEKVISQSDYDQSLSDYETALAGARSAKSALTRAKINLKYATIVAPVSGVVISRNVDRGQTVAASFSTPTLFAIANDLTKMQVQASIDEADIGKIQVGQEVTFTVDAYPDMTFNGSVRQVRLQPVTLQNVVNYTVIIDVPNPELKLMPGMTANITVKIQEALGVTKIPASALKFWPPQDYLDKAINEMPDSVKKMIERIMAFRQRMNSAGGQTGQSLQGGQSGQGGQTRQGGQAGYGGGEGRSQGMNGQGMRSRAGEGSHSGRSRGLVWVKTADNKLIPYRVKPGLSDGSYTAIEGNLKEGDEVVIGMINTQSTTTTTQTQQSPFQPQMPRPTGSRGGR